MTDGRMLDLQARQFEDQALAGDELRELEQARQSPNRIANLLQEDWLLHAELKELHRIDSTAAKFVNRCAASIQQQLETRADSLGPAPAVEGLSMRVAMDDRSVQSQSQSLILPSHTLEAFELTVDRGVSMGTRSRFRQRNRLRIGSFAAVLVVLLTIGWLMIPSDDDRNRQLATSRIEKAEIAQPHDLDFADRVKQLGPMQAETPWDEAAETTEPAQRPVGELRSSDDVVWEVAPRERFSYPAAYQLRSGMAELVLDDGTELAFEGPAGLTLLSPRSVQLDQGRFRIRPAVRPEQVLITTPTVRLNGKDKFLAFLDVKSEEGTLVQLEQGELKASPWGQDRGEEIQLSAQGLNRGVFGPPWRKGSDQLASAMAMNPNGAFTGLLAAGDRPVRFGSPQVFAQVLASSRALINDNPQRFAIQWNAMVEKLEQSAANTALNINGRSLRPSNASEMLEQFLQVGEQMALERPVPQGTFEPRNGQPLGTLNVNGTELPFQSLNEFRDAQQQMFGTLLGEMMAERASGSPARFGFQFQGGSAGAEVNRANGARDDRDANRDANRDGGRAAEGEGLPASQSSVESESFFSGSINSNGQIIHFNSLEDFNRALHRLPRSRR